MEHAVVNSFSLARGHASSMPDGNRLITPGPRGEAFPFNGVVQTPRCAQTGFINLGLAMREVLDLPASIRMDAVQYIIAPSAYRTPGKQIHIRSSEPNF